MKINNKTYEATGDFSGIIWLRLILVLSLQKYLPDQRNIHILVKIITTAEISQDDARGSMTEFCHNAGVLLNFTFKIKN